MGMQAVAHASLPNFLAGWLRDLPAIADKLSQPNVEALLNRIAPLDWPGESNLARLLLQIARLPDCFLCSQIVKCNLANLALPDWSSIWHLPLPDCKLQSGNLWPLALKCVGHPI